MSAALRSADIHARVDWLHVLADLGVDQQYLRKKHGPCPVCGGTDRYRFTNYRARGDYICNQCGAGDGFTLLRKLKGWNFKEALQQVALAAGLLTPRDAENSPRNPAHAEELRWRDPPPRPDDTPAVPSRRVLDLLRTSCDTSMVADVRAYLGGRGLWPLPPGHGLRAHAMADDYREGRFPALIGKVVDINGELVTAHVTFLKDGRKRPGDAPRKIISKMTGRAGCAVRLVPAGRLLGIAEGIETALSAYVLHGVPTWAALNAVQLEKFAPPSSVNELHVFADRDIAGLEAAGRLVERLAARITVRLRVPPADVKDFNDVLLGRRAS
jgi:putative DNA primase/helicase